MWRGLFGRSQTRTVPRHRQTLREVKFRTGRHDNALEKGRTEDKDIGCCHCTLEGRGCRGEEGGCKGEDD